MSKDNKYKSWMIRNINDYIDYCGEVNCTKLAEDCAEEFEFYEGDDYEIPEALFDLAFEVSQTIETKDEEL